MIVSLPFRRVCAQELPAAIDSIPNDILLGTLAVSLLVLIYLCGPAPLPRPHTHTGSANS